MINKNIKNKTLEGKICPGGLNYPQVRVLSERVRISNEEITIAKILDDLYAHFPHGFTVREANKYTSDKYGFGKYEELLYPKLVRLGLATKIPSNHHKEKDLGKSVRYLYLVKPGNMLKLDRYWKSIELGQNLIESQKVSNLKTIRPYRP